MSDRDMQKVSPDGGAVRRRKEIHGLPGADMIDVREVLRRWQAGQSARKIGRDTGANRNTASRYIGGAVQPGLPKERELTDEDIQAVAQRVQDRPEPDRSRDWEEVAQHPQRIEDPQRT